MKNLQNQKQKKKLKKKIILQKIIIINFINIIITNKNQNPLIQMKNQNQEIIIIK